MRRLSIPILSICSVAMAGVVTALSGCVFEVGPDALTERARADTTLPGGPADVIGDDDPGSPNPSNPADSDPGTPSNPSEPAQPLVQ